MANIQYNASAGSSSATGAGSDFGNRFPVCKDRILSSSPQCISYNNYDSASVTPCTGQVTWSVLGACTATSPEKDPVGILIIITIQPLIILIPVGSRGEHIPRLTFHLRSGRCGT